jgi:hypothetical protein
MLLLGSYLKFKYWTISHNIFHHFRQVVEGSETLKKLEGIETLNQRPKKACRIIDSGVFEFKF